MESLVEFVKEPESWVIVGLVIFLGILVVLKVPGVVARALDAKTGQIRTALEEAERLRAEAETVLADLQKRRAAMEHDAAEMLADARLEAQRLEAEAKVKLEEQILRRTELADRRIALAESQATAEVKAAAAELAADTAQQVLVARMATQKKDPITDKAIAGLAERMQ
jgi:F-type H+-transporting ATPase subunit b